MLADNRIGFVGCTEEKDGCIFTINLYCLTLLSLARIDFKGTANKVAFLFGGSITACDIVILRTYPHPQVSCIRGSNISQIGARLYIGRISWQLIDMRNR